MDSSLLNKVTPERAGWFSAQLLWTCETVLCHQQPPWRVTANRPCDWENPCLALSARTPRPFLELCGFRGWLLVVLCR